MPLHPHIIKVLETHQIEAELKASEGNEKAKKIAAALSMALQRKQIDKLSSKVLYEEIKRKAAEIRKNIKQYSKEDFEIFSIFYEHLKRYLEQEKHTIFTDKKRKEALERELRHLDNLFLPIIQSKPA